MNKNDNIQLNIVDMTNEGLGIAKEDNLIFFVKDGIVGDTVNAVITKVSKNIIYAKAIEIIQKSEYRVEAKCDICRKCGGCTLQELDYKKQLEIKENLVKRNLLRIGNIDSNIIDVKYDGIIGMEEPYYYRNKMQVPFSINSNNENIYGFYAGRTHSIIEFDTCHICFYEASEIVNKIKNWCNENNIIAYDEKKKKGLLRHVLIRKGFKTNEIGICLVINDNTYPKSLITKCFDLVKKLKEYRIASLSLNLNMNRDNVILGEKTINIIGKEYINDILYVDNTQYKFQISTQSFYQINPKQAEKLYSIVVDYAKEIKNKQNHVLDLYCGIGTIGIFLAKYFDKVVGIEVVEKAIENAKENARINGINNIQFYAHNVENENLFNEENIIIQNDIDLLVIDPPRKGLDINTINAIEKINPKNIIYVSCDSSTLARDLKILNEKNYKIQKYKIVDMFPHTMHVETVALISKIEK